MGVSAKVVADSTAFGSRIITMEIELHRMILPEFNTHRTFSRNFQSSRALPLARQRDLIKEDPATPVWWGKNQRGMVAQAELGNIQKARAQGLWQAACEHMIHIHELMEEEGVHKQIANRLLEPFMYTKGVVTATYDNFKAFFKLRCAEDAQPEIKALADAMRDAVLSSIPRKLDEGEWHLPYVDLETFEGTLEEAVKVSVSCCAQVSYRNLDDSLDKALVIYDMLNLNGNGGNPHASPCEHQAVVSEMMFSVEQDDPFAFHPQDVEVAGNLEFPWFQYRKQLGV